MSQPITVDSVRLCCHALLGATFLTAMACGKDTAPTGSGDPVVTTDSAVTAGATPRTIALAVGQHLEITLGTFGPGDWDSLPARSNDAVQFVASSLVQPYVPAGPTRRFRFVAAAPGTTIVTLQQHGRDAQFTNATLVDTVVVR